jgi:RNA polymerase sigma factor (sigma-70 family)
MANVALGSVARQLESLFEGGSAAGFSDRKLLERFTARGEPADEAAFAAMVERHAPMVLGVCRQLLGDHHHAEDAFQAVFLVLARQARSIRDPDLLGAWLYGVALRTARTSRIRIARRRRTEEEGAVRQSTAGPCMAADRAMLEREQAEALYREIERLPGAFRVPVVLCYFEGLTLDEAAHRLQWPAGTLRSRLARAREKLRRGLTRRGFALSTTALTAARAPRSARASLSPLLCDTTTRAAIHFADRHAAGAAFSAPTISLAQEVLNTMLWHKLGLAALSLLLIATLAAAAGYHSLNAFASPREGEPPGEPRRNPARTDFGELSRAEPRPPGITQGRLVAPTV